MDLNQQCLRREIYSLLGLPIFLHILGEKYGNRTRDNGITTRGFATKLISPYVNTFRGGVLRRRSTKLIVNVFTYGGTEEI